MKLIVARNALLQRLTAVIGAADPRSPVTALQCVRLTGIPGRGVELHCNNTELELATALEMDVGAFSLCIQAKKLREVLGALPELSEVTLDLDPAGDAVTLRSGRSRFKLAALPGDQFPAFTGSQPDFGIAVEPSAFKRLLKKTAECAAAEDVRYFLKGVLLHPDKDKLMLGGSDGCAAAYGYIAAELSEGEPRDIIIPRPAAQAIIKLLPDEAASDPLLIDLAENTITLEAAGVRLSAKPIVGRYPDLQRVTPSAYDLDLELDRAALADAIKRAALLTGEFPALDLTIENGELTITGAHEAESSQEVLPVEHESPCAVTFDSRLLTRALGAIDSKKVSLRLNAVNGTQISEPGKHEEFRYIVMPVRK